MNIALLNGPNLNLLGTREPALYGSRTLAELEADLARVAASLGATLSCVQRNGEGELIDAIHALRGHCDGPIINAGDGQHEHPTQALLDARTILDNRPSLEGLRVAIIGDILHSRVARSNIHLLSKFGVDIVLCGPAPLAPQELKNLAPGVTITYDIKEALRDTDIIMMLRVQLERQNETSFPAGEYSRFYGLRAENLALAKPDAIVMHPGPMNRGREISTEVADSSRSVILSQVENGIAVRMAVLEKVLR